MRLPGRISAAIEILGDLDRRRRPVSDALRDWGLNHRFAGSGDRAAIGNLVYDALRRRLSHAHIMGSEDPRALILAVAVRDWGEDAGGLNAAFAEDRFAPDPIADEEAARLAADGALADAPAHVRADVPEWLAPRMEAALGGDWIAEAEALTARPPLDLRVNPLRSNDARVQKSLRRFAPHSFAPVPHALRIPPGARDARQPNAQADEGYRKGWFEIQDAGSQWVTHLCGAEPGEQVLDFCAGGGGKTLALAAAMEGRGQVFAHDADRNRLAPIHDRLRRAGARNVQVRSPEPDALADLEAAMDLVVVDAPCTGTGTWRRHPDAKWRLTAAQLTQRMNEQTAILADAARYVKPGGRLAYITCSLLEEENDEQVERFMAESGLFSPTVRPDAETAALSHAGGVGLTLTPRKSATDGFYFSLMQRAVS